MSDDYTDALVDGRWINDRGVQRWVPNPTRIHHNRPRRPRPPCGTERGYQWHRHQWRRWQRGTWPLPTDDPCGCKGAHRAWWHWTQRQKEVA